MRRITSFLISYLAITVSAGLLKREDSCSCSVDPNRRIDCGYVGISESECINVGCCWSSSDIDGVPWCYYTVSGGKTTDCVSDKSCEVDANSRQDCGYIGITQNECVSSGCCWAESSINGVPWCFYSKTKPVKTTTILKATTTKITTTLKVTTSKTTTKNSLPQTPTPNPIKKCPSNEASRVDCGFTGITKGRCEFNGCCWARSLTEGIPWCFNKIEETNKIEKPQITVRFQKPSNWDTVNLWAWDDEDNNIYGDVWPGKPITNVGNGWFSYTFPEEINSVNVLFNNGYDQTEDIRNVNGPTCLKYQNGGVVSTVDCGLNDIEMCMASPSSRVQCGEAGITEQQCQMKNCCYNELAGYPSCYQPASVVDGDCVYTVTDVQKSKDGINAILDLEGKVCEKYDIDFQTLDFQAKFETDTRLHIHIQPTDIENYPHNTDMPHAAYPFEVENEQLKNLQYSYELTEGEGFKLKVKRNDGSVVFDGVDFIFERQYLKISKNIRADSSIYGFGEVFAPYKRNSQSTKHALWNADNATPIGQNLYGSHPFYIEIIDGKAYGFFLKNSHGMEFTINNNIMTIEVIGGNFDMYFFMGPTMEDVTKQYYKVIGAPALLPYWTLGWHQCRYGYPDIWAVEDVVSNYKKNNIPLDTMWIDIDYMDRNRDFTYHKDNYPVSEVQNFVKTLKTNHQYYINMIDPAIAIDNTYPSFARGIEKDIFIKDRDGNLFEGEVWPEGTNTAFPDWHHPNILEYWKNEIKLFKDMAMTDGNWIDMNEAANFCNGFCNSPYDDPGFIMGEFNPRVPPFAISNLGNKSALKTKTLDMDVQYYGGLIDYDIHNIYGHMEAIITNKALLEIDPIKRPFLLSRSSFPGTGKYAAHWLGDNHSTWEHLYYSIPTMLNFQFYGIPMVGSDTCGFVSDSNEELCARWMEVGAFNPFGRNHNGKGYIPQEPYVWDSVAEASRRALAIRYKILPYMYTLLVRTHTQSEMILYSFAAEWPNDTTALGIDRQFLMGKGILITPVLEKGKTSVAGYFPEGVWYDWYTHESFSGPAHKTLEAELCHIPVHIRGGHIIPTQGPSLTVYENRNKPFELLVALDANKKAFGRLYLDDGISINVNGRFSEIEYSVQNNTLTASGKYNYNEAQKLHEITILGVTSKPSTVVVNGDDVIFTFNSNELIIKDLDISMNDDFTVSWK